MNPNYTHTSEGKTLFVPQPIGAIIPLLSCTSEGKTLFVPQPIGAMHYSFIKLTNNKIFFKIYLHTQEYILIQLIQGCELIGLLLVHAQKTI